jgi:gamma-F420-2:alpha-L-glutamate ligase
MDVIVVTGDRKLYANRRFREAARQRGLKLSFMSPADKGADRPRIVLLRLGLGRLEEGLALGRRFEAEGCRVINPPACIEVLKNKWRSHRKALENALPSPPTFLWEPGKSPEDILEYSALSFPLVLKSLYGSKGLAVHKIDGLETLKEKAALYHKRGYDCLIQEFLEVEEEFRALMLGKQMLVCLQRETSDFRGNWHQGALLKAISPSHELRKLAEDSARCFQTDFAGIDILKTKKGFFLLELNDSPGFEGLENCCRLDVAGALLDYAFSPKETP